MRPSGTVTFLMSDIEGSTRLLRTLGVDRYEAALQAHRALMREAFARYAGFEVGSQGDSLFVAFGRAQDAVHAAVDAQCALAGHAKCVKEATPPGCEP
jgi:class 3 adenylate cyclase